MVTPSTAYTVGLLYPQGGPAGLLGPSCHASADLAARDINARGGILGREIELRPIDASPGPQGVMDEVDRLIGQGSIDAIVGWHTSDVRRTLAHNLDQRVPYIYTALYEGGENAPGVYLTGETPELQIEPALRWLRDEMGLRRWFLVGSDYVWARRSAAACERYARSLGLDLCAQRFRPLGTDDFTDVYRQLQEAEPQGVLMLMLGQDAVHFNRGFAAAGLHQVMHRYSSLMDENMLLASGPESTENLTVSAGFFESLVTANTMSFSSHYFSAYGPDACLPTSVGESCYEGMLLLESLHRAAGSTQMERLLANERTVGYDGPRGALSLRRGHTPQPVYLANAQECEFVVVDAL